MAHRVCPAASRLRHRRRAGAGQEHVALAHQQVVRGEARHDHRHALCCASSTHLVQASQFHFCCGVHAAGK